MKTLHHAALISAALAVTASAAAGTATAQTGPAPTPPPNSISVEVVPGVHYTADVSSQSALLQTAFGSLTTRGGQFQILDNQDHLVAGTPLPRQPQTGDWSTAAQPESSVAARVAATPVQSPNPLRHNVDAAADYNGALAIAATQFGLASGVGAMGGGLAGLAVGCPIGAVTAGLAALPTGPADLVISPLGCLVGASVMGGIGAIVGGAAVGIPVGIASGVQAYNSLHAAGDI
ncbi:hypothetical protein FOS14_05285 [Skermania sp. ID1734]|uniref:hypothetical protein n=1 Tax=Skermania sp. ID1734 TaxID=2597516 RepID=UPI00117E91B7|nr:hypothetical protein [Skermania sp. ID1734]TSE01156.1 hypothetical protein FOS14_05285 [Skermania sp. ID1734]